MRRLLPVLALSLLSPAVARADPDTLWRIVHGQCVPHMQAGTGPAPCARVDLNGGTAVLKDRNGMEQYLLIPTERVTGIESPALLQLDRPNYFAAAWATVPLVDERLHRQLPRTDLALAINSAYGRSQDQLHIHVDCIRPDIRAALDRAQRRIGRHWAMLPMTLSRHRYRALWIDGDALGRTDPFDLLSASLRDPAHEMARHTLVLVGAERDGHAGFVLLDGLSGPVSVRLTDTIRLGPGSGEELQDHTCAIAAAA